MGALGRCPSTALERGILEKGERESREGERFLLGTNTFHGRDSTALGRPYYVAGLVSCMTHYI